MTLVFSDRAAKKLKAAIKILSVKLDLLTQLGEENKMALSDELNAIAARVDDGLTNIADDIRRLSESIPPVLSEEEVVALKAKFEALAARTEGIAAQTPDA